MLLLRYPLVAELGEERRDRHADHVRHGGHVHDADVEAVLELVVVEVADRSFAGAIVIRRRWRVLHTQEESERSW